MNKRDDDDARELIAQLGDELDPRAYNDEQWEWHVALRHGDPGPIGTEPAISGGWPLPSREPQTKAGRRWWKVLGGLPDDAPFIAAVEHESIADGRQATLARLEEVLLGPLTEGSYSDVWLQGDVYRHIKAALDDEAAR